MKNLFKYLICLFVLFLLNSCNEEAVMDSTTKTETFTKKVKIKKGALTGKNDENNANVQEIEVTFYAEIDDVTDIVVSWSASENLYELIEMDHPELERFLEEGMGTEVYNSIYNHDSVESTTPHSDCMRVCDTEHLDQNGDKIPGKKGYGKCRFRCWVDTAVRVIESIFAN